MIEALAYLGGAIVLVGAMLIGAQYWPDLGTGARLLIVGTAALVLLAAGFAVPARAGTIARRLRSILWLLSTSAGAAFWALLGHQALDWQAQDTALLTGVGSAVYAAVLWGVTRSAIQQLATFLATLVTAGTAAAHLDGSAWPGIAVWAVSAAWLAVGRAGLLAAKRLTQATAAAGLIIGAGLTMDGDAAIVFALATTIALISAGVIWREIAVVLVGAFGLVQFLPMAVTTWFSGRAAAPVALLFGGGVLVTSAVVLARRTAERRAAESLSIGPERYDAVVFDLAGKPDPAVLLLAARRLGAEPGRTAVLVDAPAGAAAGRTGGFGLIVGVDRTGHPDDLLAAGADVVVRDLDQLTAPDGADPVP